MTNRSQDIGPGEFYAVPDMFIGVQLADPTQYITLRNRAGKWVYQAKHRLSPHPPEVATPVREGHPEYDEALRWLVKCQLLGLTGEGDTHV